MAGTLTIGTLSDGTNSTSSTNAIMGSAKAWVNFNGTGTAAIRNSYNVSSITDNGTGDYTFSFTTALPTADYVTIGAVQSGGSSGNNGILAEHTSSFTTAPTLKTTSQVRVSTKQGTDNSTALDAANCYIAFFC